MTPCPVCGATGVVVPGEVLWDDLIRTWGIDSEETAYIERQQMERCVECGMTLRSRMLAEAMMSTLGYRGLFRDFVRRYRGRVLELNEASTLTEYVRRFRHRVLGEYPEVDMTAMTYADRSFDVVVHSDTLEHVPDPVTGLAECRRVLKPGGFLFYTVPIIVGRLTRSRKGLEPSYHGSPDDPRDDYLVQTEFGADAWTTPMQAGFSDVRMLSSDFPASLVIVARR